VQGGDGALYINDFERRRILRSDDGTSIDRSSAGLGGSGIMVPRLAVSGELLLATEPQAQRLLVFDADGKQRGVVVFTTQPPVTPLGLAATADGLVYVAGLGTGRVYRFILTPPESAPSGQ
jgi:hypothetical protein